MNTLRRHLHTLKATVAAALLAATVASCGDEHQGYNDKISYAEIVTVAPMSADGLHTFTFRRRDDSPLITLTAAKLPSTAPKEGKRALLLYVPASGEPYASGAITVRSISTINTDTAIVRPIERYRWDANPVFLNSVWRTGDYLNFRFRADYSDRPRFFGLVVDSVTATEPWPKAYLMHNLNGAPQNYLRESYASFDISSVWQRPGCLGLEVHVADSNLPQDVYRFTK